MLLSGTGYSVNRVVGAPGPRGEEALSAGAKAGVADEERVTTRYLRSVLWLAFGLPTTLSPRPPPKVVRAGAR